MQTAYFDESANSGENLLDLEQPVFALGAVCLDAADAVALLQSMQSRLPHRSGEPKYSKVAKSSAGRAAMLSALESLPAGVAFVSLAHKRFMIVSKMIDLLVVEFARADGYDMYADGSAVGLANLAHLTWPVLGDADAFTNMLHAFVEALRPNRPTSLNDFFDAVTAYRATAPEKVRGHVDVLRAARSHAEALAQAIDSRQVSDTLDPALPCLVSLCRGVAQTIDTFHLVHDHSKIIAKHAQQLLNLDALPPATPNLPSTKLPVADIIFADSASTPQLQIADWVAGATRHVGHAVMTGTLDNYTTAMKHLVESWMIDSVWPNPDLITTPRRL